MYSGMLEITFEADWLCWQLGILLRPHREVLAPARLTARQRRSVKKTERFFLAG